MNPLFAFLLLGLMTLTLVQIQATPIILITRFDDLPIFDAETGSPYKNCGGSESIIKRVEISPCDHSDGDTCQVHRGTNITFQMSFVSQTNTKTLEAKIYGVKDWIPVPFPCPQPDACQNSGLVCPITKGTLYNYTLSAPVLENYPKMSIWIKGELKDDRGNMFLCVEVPIKIV